jgi:hypothetical protein
MRALNAQALALLARIEAGERIPAVQLVELQFAVPERYCTAGINVVWGGFTWLGIGLQVEPVENTVGDMPSITLALPAVSEAQISLALTQPVEGTVLRIYDALLDPDTGVVADAVLSWSGALNMPGVEDGPQASINVLAEHRGVLALRPRPSRYTDDEQQRLYPGDTCLQFDPATDAAPLAWPAAAYLRK